MHGCDEVRKRSKIRPTVFPVDFFGNRKKQVDQKTAIRKVTALLALKITYWPTLLG